MKTFDDLNLSKQLRFAIDDLGFITPTPIQHEAYPVILSGKNVVGIAQTGTGKTLGYMLPILQGLKFSNQIPPRVLVLVPTRELVMQVVEQIQLFTKYVNLRVLGVYGESNINAQRQLCAQGTDIIVATPGRLYDLGLGRELQLKSISKLVIDEVDVMLDLGFRPQLINIFDLIPQKRQNIMFSATMTDEVDDLIEDFFIAPTKISIAVSGTPLEKITQQCYSVKNFNTKVNLLAHLLEDKDTYKKVLVFISNKRLADRLYDSIAPQYGHDMGIIHSNKSQNFRIRAVEEFESGAKRILIATDVMARGLDLTKITHVINFDTPNYPENYMHRIGRTGRADQSGTSLLFFTEKEETDKKAIEELMKSEIAEFEIPEEVIINNELIPEERPRIKENKHFKKSTTDVPGPSFHEKIEKNLKVNEGGSYLKKLAKKYKKPQSRGDKFQNKKKK